MHIPKTKKKILLSAIMTTGLALAITQAATASPGYRGGYQGCQKMMDGYQNQVTQKAKEKLLNDTTEIRKQIAQKRAAMRATMQSENPDVNTVAVLAGELFDLREQMRVKAQEAGLPVNAVMGAHGSKKPGERRGPGFSGQRL